MFSGRYTGTIDVFINIILENAISDLLDIAGNLLDIKDLITLMYLETKKIYIFRVLGIQNELRVCIMNFYVSQLI